jgi:phospholipid/cholesterol/gamma-HCH transport system permease protein
LNTQATTTFEVQKGGKILINLAGVWSISKRGTKFPDLEPQLQKVKPISEISFNLANVQSWDTSLVAFINSVLRYAAKHSIKVQTTDLPPDLQSILDLARAVPAKEQSEDGDSASNPLAKLGASALRSYASLKEVFTFTGEVTLTAFRVMLGKNKFRFSETLAIIQQCGPEALPIVTLISVLIGLILAYIGAVQLQQFGATIYVANLVGIAMLREMGAIMAAIVMAGRTGAAFAAQLGTMQVNEEIDAFKTLGISPIEILVLPRMLALVLMMPFLCLYADILGILGGAIVGIFSLDLDPTLFFRQVQKSIDLGDLFVGMVKSVVFGVLIASAGCLRGIKCSRNASAVGAAVTAAVVSSIVAIVVTDAIFAVITNILGV